MWAQRTNLVYLTIDIQDATSPTIDLTENKLEFTAVSDGKHYAATIEFHAPINVEVYVPTGPMILFTLSAGLNVNVA